MLKLRRERMVFGRRRPFVSQDLDMMAACVEHWFDGKDHARFQYDASTGAAVVQHLRRIMEYLADAMTAKITHRRKALRPRYRLNCRTNVAKGCAGPDRVNAGEHRFVRLLDQALGQDRNSADLEGAAGVAMPAGQQGRYVDVDDLALAQVLGVGRNAVRDHMID